MQVMYLQSNQRGFLRPLTHNESRENTIQTNVFLAGVMQQFHATYVLAEQPAGLSQATDTQQKQREHNTDKYVLCRHGGMLRALGSTGLCGTCLCTTG